jgi:hypothetical protein
MHEDILAIIFFDEPVPLFLVKPLDNSFRHDALPPPLVLWMISRTVRTNAQIKKAEP